MSEEAKKKRKKKTPRTRIAEIYRTGERQKTADKEYEAIAREAKWVDRPLDEPKLKIAPLRTHTVLDEILGGGGLGAGKLAMLYGEFAAGKTQTLFTLAVEAEGLVYFIDTEGTFSRRRIREIAEERGKDVEAVNRRLKLVQPGDWESQVAALYNIPSPMDLKEGEKISLIVIDSLLAYFASTADFAGRESLTGRQQILKAHLRKLREIAKIHNAVAVFTTQVYQEPTATGAFLPKWTTFKPQGGNAVLHIPDFIIFLRKQPTTNIRIARLMDSSEIPQGEVVFLINEKGVDNIPEEAKEERPVKKAMKSVESKEKDWKYGSPEKPAENGSLQTD